MIQIGFQEEHPPRFYVFGELSQYMNLSDLPDEVSNPIWWTVKKAVVGEKHAFVLLDNGVLLMSGSNEIGQLGMDPKLYPEFHDLQIHPELNSDYEVEDIACGSYHTVVLAKDRGFPWLRHIFTFGHKGCLGVNKYENTHLW